METKRTPKITPRRTPRQTTNRTFDSSHLPDTLVFIVNPRGQALTTENLMPEKNYILGFSTAEKALDFILESEEAGIFTGSYSLSFFTRQEYLANIRGSTEKILVDMSTKKLMKGTDFLIIRWRPPLNWDEKPMKKI